MIYASPCHLAVKNPSLGGGQKKVRHTLGRAS